MLENDFIVFHKLDAEPGTFYDEPAHAVFGERLCLYKPFTEKLYYLLCDGREGLMYEATDSKKYVTNSIDYQTLLNAGWFRYKISHRITLLDEPVVYVSNPIIVHPAGTDITKVQFKCDRDEFGFPFSSSNEAPYYYLPIIANNPQYGQEDKVYEKSDGGVEVLYAKYFKEYDCETEYLPESMHDRIMAILSCDEVSFDGVRVSKSGNYEVDWEQKGTDDNDHDVAKASFKMRENTNSRNSNY